MHSRNMVVTLSNFLPPDAAVKCDAPKLWSFSSTIIQKTKVLKNSKVQHLDTRCVEIGEIGPIAELARIATDTDKGGV